MDLIDQMMDEENGHEIGPAIVTTSSGPSFSSNFIPPSSLAFSTTS